jgi:hypothetical protein
MKCKCCRREEDEHFGRNIAGKGVAMMGYGSRHEWNIYQFTLVAGWYCYGCLDGEITQGLCQPLLEWRKCKANPYEVFWPRGRDGVDEEQGRRNWLRLLNRLGLSEDDFNK